MGGIGVPAVDGEDRVPDVLPVGAEVGIEWFDGEVGDHDIGCFKTTFSENTGIGFRGEVADDEDAAVIGGGHFFVQLEPAVL